MTAAPQDDARQERDAFQQFSDRSSWKDKTGEPGTLMRAWEDGANWTDFELVRTPDYQPLVKLPGEDVDYGPNSSWDEAVAWAWKRAKELWKLKRERLEGEPPADVDVDL